MQTHGPNSAAGYKVLEIIGKSRYATVYRASREQDPRPLLIQVLEIQAPSTGGMARLRHEYELVRALDADGIVKLLDLIDFDGKPALVMEAFDGIPLNEALADGVALEPFLEIALGLAEILTVLHRANVSHRALRPHHILLNPQSKALTITDFAFCLEAAHGQTANPAFPEDTLAYISPEQTGRMNCAVDYRTDFYSLGVTFYEMLTGRSPFQAQDPLEIIHAHIAKMPVPPTRCDPEVPARSPTS